MLQESRVGISLLLVSQTSRKGRLIQERDCPSETCNLQGFKLFDRASTFHIVFPLDFSVRFLLRPVIFFSSFLCP